MNFYNNLKYGSVLLLVMFFKLSFTQSNQKPTLHFKQNSTFRILHMTDQHYENEESIYRKNINATYYILEQTQPDLVLITGDIVSGYMWDGHSIFFPKLHELFSRPFRDKGVPYAIVIGNHDDEADSSRSQILDLERQINQSYTMYSKYHEQGYYIPIYDRNLDTEVLRLWGFDTQNTGCGGHSGSFGCIDATILQSFQEQSFNTPYGLAFLHIPPVEFIDLYNNFPTFGEANENVSCSISSPKLVELLIQKQNIQWLIAGHDHKNDFGGTYKTKHGSIEMMYGRKSGYGGYLGQPPGARILDFTYQNSQMEMSHFILDYNGNDYEDEERNRNNKLLDWCVLTNGNNRHFYIWIIIFIFFQTIIILVIGISLCKIYSPDFEQIQVEYILQNRENLPFKNFMDIELPYEEEL